MSDEPISHRDFPESTATADGMTTLSGRPGGRNVFVHLDLAYAVKDGRRLRLVVLQPSLDPSTAEPAELAAERFPLIVYVQGSGWMESSSARPWIR